MIMVDIITWILFLGLGISVAGFVIGFAIVLIKGLRNIFQDFKMPEGIDLGFCQIKFKKKDRSLLNVIRNNAKAAKEKEEEEEENKFPEIWKKILTSITKASEKGKRCVGIYPYNDLQVETDYMYERIVKRLKKEGFRVEGHSKITISW